MEITLVLVAFFFCATAFTCVGVYSDAWVRVEDARNKAMLARTREEIAARRPFE
jgi:hypothetical protein